MRYFKVLSLVLFGSALAVGCSSSDNNGGGMPGTGGANSGSACEKLCSRTASIGCAESDCVAQCETPLSACDAEYKGFVACAAESQFLGCMNGKPKADGCDAQEQAFSNCLLGGTGGTGGTGATGGTGGGSTCEQVCAKSKTAGCEPADCVTQCETELPSCDAEFDAYNQCAAEKGSISCKPDGKPDVAGCDAEEGALGNCLLNPGTGGSGGSGGGANTCYTGKGDCDPLVLDSCPSGKACDFGSDNVFHCYSAGTGQIGSSCSPGTCAPGLACVNGQSGPVCAPFCCENSDCASNSCVTVSGGGIKLCML